ncbi:HsmA family protein [Lipingzhangella sp. LS1_29]|uniref:HsmA family protein n=1 Tax=Lipingzhangella rawalii TaxID=2055835 RepID=A0ABU2H3B7_9ACTN|nr:HsmA family protein [Lipingzhangella rawalii]MDS1269796.1 HsmA family protein [Lipingzhangella rawalii]
MLAAAIVIITAALVFYTAGVWSERLQRTLRWWHAGAFGLGLACDATGTFLMSRIADARDATGEHAVSVLDRVMAISGGLALLLMAVHLVWAIVVLVRNRPRERAQFHRFSIVVWVIWLVPYIAGAAAAMSGTA